jgi:hypothetical protein
MGAEFSASLGHPRRCSHGSLLQDRLPTQWKARAMKKPAVRGAGALRASGHATVASGELVSHAGMRVTVAASQEKLRGRRCKLR